MQLQNLWQTYDDITGIKWCHSGNPLSEAVIGRIFWAKITDNQSDDFLRMLSKNDLPFSYENLRKSYLTDLQKTYDELEKNLTKFRESSPWSGV